MKKLTGIIFILMSCAVVGSSSDDRIANHLNICKDKSHIKLLKNEERDRLLIIKKQYFAELQILQEQANGLRKQANEYMISNDESKYDELYRKMNEIKEKKKLLKEKYKKEINKILNK